MTYFGLTHQLIAVDGDPRDAIIGIPRGGGVDVQCRHCAWTIFVRSKDEMPKKCRYCGAPLTRIQSVFLAKGARK